VPDIGNIEAASSTRVLIVDDDPSIRFLMREALKNGGFEVAEADNGADGLALFRSFRPDVVLLDIQMPHLDGYGTIAEIRQQPAGKMVPIVMVTGIDDPDSIRRAFDEGATDFMVKPINWPLLEHRVRSILAANQASAELQASHQKLSELEQLAPDLAIIAARDGRILEWLSQRHDDTAQRRAGDAEQTLNHLWPAPVADTLLQCARRALRTRESQSCEFELQGPAGERHYQARIEAQGRDRVLIVVQEVTTRHAVDADVYQLAYYDAETGLPNSNLFKKVAEAQLSDARLTDNGLAILFLIFDKLDRITDVLDPSVATDARRTVAQRIDESLRGADCVATIDDADDALPVARLGDNQFTVLLTGIRGRSDAAVVGERIRKSFENGFLFGGQHFDTKPRIGISVFPQDGNGINELVKAAEIAAEEARAIGAKNEVFFSNTMRLRAADKVDQTDELRWALENEQLELHYQPRIDLATREIVGAEAFLRWPHPLRGFVPLDEVLPLAEATGLILPIGEMVMRKACEQAEAWQSLRPSPLRVSVNLSRQEFAHGGLLDRITRVLGETGLAPQQFELELTERMLMRARDSLNQLEKLKGLGIGLVLDDFGTGYTSLSYLKQFPLDGLKIDQSFIAGLNHDAGDSAVSSAIIDIAHRLQIRVIAEGVESQDQLDFLDHQGCDEVQGYLFSPPLPASEFETFVAAYPKDSRPAIASV
jgi:diguanylate cyclase (GGDEF)-like protein